MGDCEYMSSDVSSWEESISDIAEAWLIKNTFRCERYRINLTREQCRQYRGRYPEACVQCDGPPESAYVKAARARAEKRKDYLACKGCGSKGKKVNRHGFCQSCNFRRFGGAT